MKKLLNHPFLQVISPSANPVLRTNIYSSQGLILLSYYEVSSLLSLLYLKSGLEDLKLFRKHPFNEDDLTAFTMIER